MKLRYVSVVLALIGSLIASSPAMAKARVLRLTVVTVSHQDTKSGFIDHDSDYIGSTVIGHDTVTCTYTGKKSARCRVLFVRPSLGTISLRFRTTATASSGHGVVTGGTRAYARATGTFTYKSLNKRATRTSVVVHLT